MNVQAPQRELVFQALRARCSEEIKQGKMQAAEATRQDLDTLEKSTGDSLYEMHRHSSEKLRSTNVSLYGDETGYRSWLMLRPEIAFPSFLLGAVGGSLLVAGVATGSPAPALVGGAIAGGLALWHGSLAGKVREKVKHHAIVGAVERNQDFIRGYVPAPPSQTASIERKVFLAGLAGQEGRLAGAGQYALAGQLRRVHDRLQQLPGATADELMENLLQNARAQAQDREILDLVQGPCSKPMAESIETLLEVSKLVAPGTLNTVQEGKESIIIGGVVLRKAA